MRDNQWGGVRATAMGQWMLEDLHMEDNALNAQAVGQETPAVLRVHVVMAADDSHALRIQVADALCSCPVSHSTAHRT